MNRSSLKTILLITIAATAILLTVCISAFAYTTATEYVKDAYVDEIKQIARLSGDRVDQFFKNQEDLAEFISSNPVVISAVETRTAKTLNEILAVLFQKMKVYENVFISTPESNPLIFADSTGKALGFRWGGQNFDDNIKQTLAGNVFLSKVGASPVTGEPVALLTVPIKRGDKVIAILGLSLSLSSVTGELVSRVKIGTDGFITITGFDGTVVAHPDKSLILKFNASNTEWGKKLLAMKSGESMEYFFKKAKIASIYRLENRQISVMAVMSKDDVTNVVRQMLFKIAACAFVFLIISIFII